MEKAYYYLEADYLLDGKEVELWGEIIHGDDGIGWYECHGYKGYDSHPYIDIENIEWDVTIYTAEENTLIDNYVNEFFDKIKEAMLDVYEPDDVGGDPDDYRDEMIEKRDCI